MIPCMIYKVKRMKVCLKKFNLGLNTTTASSIDGKYRCLGLKDGMEENLEVPDFQYHFNEIRVKLQKLNIKEHKDIPDIEKISDKKMNEMTAGEKASLQFYIDKHVFLQETQKLINSKLDLIYFILTNN